MATTRTSGFDFSDRAPELDHPDIVINPNAGPAHLQRNKTERRRLQGLMIPENNHRIQIVEKPNTLAEKWRIWMVNEGSRRIFFSVWIFLQLLVAVFGFANYELKDNNVNARATFGITYRKSLLSIYLLLLIFC